MTGLEWFTDNVLERVNAAWLALDFCFAAYMIYYVWVTSEHLNWGMLSWWRHSKVPQYLQAAVAILVFQLGDLGIRLVVWYYRHSVNGGRVGLPHISATLLILGFSLVAVWGILCQLRVFSNPWLGKWVWIAGALAAAVAAVLTQTLPI